MPAGEAAGAPPPSAGVAGQTPILGAPGGRLRPWPPPSRGRQCVQKGFLQRLLVSFSRCASGFAGERGTARAKTPAGVSLTFRARSPSQRDVSTVICKRDKINLGRHTGQAPTPCALERRAEGALTGISGSPGPRTPRRGCSGSGCCSAACGGGRVPGVKAHPPAGRPWGLGDGVT